MKEKKEVYFYVAGIFIIFSVSLGLLKIVDRAIPFLKRSIGEKSKTRESFEEKEPKQLLRFKGIKEPYPRNRYMSYVIWGYKDSKNPDSNIVEGYRKSYNPSCSLEQTKKTIWMFGGSTMLGQGSPDDFTIPSFLCKQLEAKHPETCWRCKNFGIGGYVFTQEVVLFIKLLQTNRPNPDLVIFYDGVNDFIASLQGYPNDHHNFTRIRDTFENRPVPISKRLLNLLPNISNLIRGFLNKPELSKENKTLIRKNLLRSSKIYKFNYQLLNDIASSKKIKVITTFQPTIYSKIFLSDYESWHLENFNYDTFTNEQLRPLWDFYYTNVVSENLRPLSNNIFIDLTQAFDGAKHSVYYNPGDWMHVNWNGNLRVAKALSKHMTTLIDP